MTLSIKISKNGTWQWKWRLSIRDCKDQYNKRVSLFDLEIINNFKQIQHEFYRPSVNNKTLKINGKKRNFKRTHSKNILLRCLYLLSFSNKNTFVSFKIECQTWKNVTFIFLVTDVFACCLSMFYLKHSHTFMDTYVNNRNVCLWHEILFKLSVWIHNLLEDNENVNAIKHTNVCYRAYKDQLNENE